MTQPHHSPTDAPATAPLRVWDLPTRLFHWLLVLCVIGLVVTAEVGDALMVWHFRLGYTVFTLLLFRLIWGFVGGYWSRFAQFLYSPQTIWAYARSQSHAQERPGHNPLGSLSVWALLLLLLLQVATGLMSDDEISNAGPWVPLVSGAVSALATTWHTTLGKLMLIVLVLLHVSAIAYYKKRKGRDLLRPMITGDAAVTAPADSSPWPASRDQWRERLWALLIVLGCALLVRQLVNLAA